MALNVSIFVGGLISVAYPYTKQNLTSHARLSGSVFAIPGKLPKGTAYLIDQLQPVDAAQVTPSHILHGKKYLLETLTYYIDGNAYREVDYTEDEIDTYQFNQDYLPNILDGVELSAGDHRLTIAARFYSLQNPGVGIYDVLNMEFVYDPSSVSLRGYLDKVAPQQFLSETDHQLTLEMLDWVMTQRTEGAIKRDIDIMETFYDLENVPDSLLPYLTANFGYQYFAGLLGANGPVREELKFLPEWQKSAGTKEAMITLLRAFGLKLDVIPLYIDLVQNLLLPGVQKTFKYTEEVRVPVNTKASRLSFRFAHPAHFVPSTVSISIKADEVEVMRVAWDLLLKKPVITYFYTPTMGNLADYWLSPNIQDAAPVPTVQGDIIDLFIDHPRGGFVVAFDSLITTCKKLRMEATYRYEMENRPGRNTRLSEFFDIRVRMDGKPNVLTAGDYQRIVEVVKRSKPLTTKLRSLVLPIKYADAYHVNVLSIASSGDISNTDRLSALNIDRQSVNLSNPVREQLKINHFRREIEGFTFGWEKDCNRWENRFGIFQSMALNAEVYDQQTQDSIRSDTLVQRGYAAVVPDDANLVTDQDKRRYARRLGLQERNFKGGDSRCKVITDWVGHYHTIKLDVPESPAIQFFRNLIIDLDDPAAFSPANEITFMFDQFVSPTRVGKAIKWDGTNLVSGDVNGPIATPETWDTDTADQKVKTWISPSNLNGVMTLVLTLIRFPDQAAIDAFYILREDNRNIQFELNKWYAVWDLEGDFFTYPTHLSAHFDFVYANFQNQSCCDELGTLTGAAPALNFNNALTAGYNYQGVELSVLRLETNDEVAKYRWNGGYWETILSDPLINMAVGPAALGDWTATLLINGTVTYTGLTLNAYNYKLVLCLTRQGNTLKMTPKESLEDSFSEARLRRGQISPFNVDEPYLGGLYIQDLIDMRHRMNVPLEMAIDGFFFRSSDGSPQVGQLFPGLRMTLIPPAPLTQLVWDQIGMQFDGVSFYDNAPGTPQFIHILHFPKRIVIETTDTFVIGLVPFYYSDAAIVPVHYLGLGDTLWIHGVVTPGDPDVSFYFTLFGDAFPPDSTYISDQS